MRVVDLFWGAAPLSMMAEPIAYFDKASWDTDARLNLDLAGVEYERLLDQVGVAKERF